MPPRPPQNILAVDDHPDFTALLAVLFAEHNVRQASTASDALKQARLGQAHHYKLYYHQPDMRGLKLCRTIRRFDHNTPILMMSAQAIEREAKAAGADTFLPKTGNVAQLIQCVSGLLEKQALRDESAFAVERATIAAEIQERARQQAKRDAALKSAVTQMGHIVDDARRSIDSIRALRAKAFQQYLSEGGARAGFVAHWPKLADVIPLDDID